MNGTMKYTRRVNLGNYEHKEFTAEISFSTVDEDDYLTQKGIIDRAADMAVAVAEIRLGLLRPSSEPVKAAANVQVARPITKEEVEKASKPALHLVETAQPAVVLPDDDGVIVTVAEPVEPTLEDFDAKDGFDAAAPVEPEITYDEMLSLVNGWVSAGEPTVRQGRVVAFQKLMRKYATQLSAIPQDRRVGFVAEFTELQAATK